jgi:DNA-binding NtrC family response regulator
MSKRVLWLDNDIPYLRPYVKALKDRDYEVHLIASLTKAEELLDEYQFDLVIIDVMVPTQNEAEAVNYPYQETDSGHKSGLVFYKRIKRKLVDKLPAVAVMTVRLDQNIRNEFTRSGLKNENFVTKYSVREVSSFVKKIESILGS